MNLKSYLTQNGHELLYTGSPDLSMFENLAEGPGDCWHSSFNQGYKNALNEIVFQAYVTWWYVNDFDDLDECVSWRINPNAFVIRKSHWDLFGGFDGDFVSLDMKGLSFGFDLIRNGGIPMYVKGLFTEKQIQFKSYPTKDLFTFFRKKFKKEHVDYLLIRRGFFKPSYWKSYFATKNFLQDTSIPFVSPKKLNPIKGNPTVSFLIPTMMRQEMTHQLLMDLNEQTYLPSTVIIVDATPEEKREMHWYDKKQFSFELVVKWQTSKGSCRGRNEAIELSKDDYIIFADDDIRIPPNYLNPASAFKLFTLSC